MAQKQSDELFFANLLLRARATQCQVSHYEPITCAQDRVEYAYHGSTYTRRDVQHVCDVYNQAKGLNSTQEINLMITIQHVIIAPNV